MNTTMKTHGKEGTAFIAVLLLAVIGALAVGSFVKISANNARLSRQVIEYQQASIIAEAGLEYGMMQLKDILWNYQFTPNIDVDTLQAQLDALPPPVDVGNYEYMAPSGDDSFRIEVVSTPRYETITNGSAVVGSVGNVQDFVIVCGAKHKSSGAGAVLKQSVQAVGLYLIRFGVFYQEDLEILPGPTMTFEGPVHSNSDLYLGGPLSFLDRLTSHGDVFHNRKDKDSSPGEARIVNENGDLTSMIDTDGSYLDSNQDDWMTTALTRWDGNFLTKDHGVSELSPPIAPLDEPHDIIERPLHPSDPDYNTLTEEEKFSNKAGINIHVTSTGKFTATNYAGLDVSHLFNQAILTEDGDYNGNPEFSKSSSGQYVYATNGSYDVSNSFTDAREGSTMAPVDIYVDELVRQASELFTTYSVPNGRGIIHVTRDDPDGSGGVIPCVRIRNGTELPIGGLSIVSDLPVYVEGQYNTTDTKPALVAGDSVTMLSSNWQDARSTAPLSDRVPEDTTYKTVVMTGNTETTTGNYNGGLENVLRFLEKWNTGPKRTVTFRGSIIDLWYSEIASSPWSYGQYYTAPYRDWGYDQIYLTQNPPGMTQVYGMEELRWARTTWAEEGWE